MQVDIKHVKGMHFQGLGSSKTVINIDAGVSAGGSGSGASPMELVLMSLAGCSGMDIVAILEKMKISYTDLKIIVEGVRAIDHPRVFTEVNIIYHFAGESLSEDKLRRAVTLSLEKYCSVANMLNESVSLNYQIEIE